MGSSPGDWDAACIACRAAAAENSNGRFIAWVLMPDHFHGLLLVGETARLSEAMRLFKGRVAVEVNRLRRCSGPLWQSTFTITR
jgi:putative transposase